MSNLICQSARKPVKTFNSQNLQLFFWFVLILNIFCFCHFGHFPGAPCAQSLWGECHLQLDNHSGKNNQITEEHYALFRCDRNSGRETFFIKLRVYLFYTNFCYTNIFTPIFLFFLHQYFSKLVSKFGVKKQNFWYKKN